jgi:hypothetical protein
MKVKRMIKEQKVMKSERVWKNGKMMMGNEK